MPTWSLPKFHAFTSSSEKDLSAPTSRRAQHHPGNPTPFRNLRNSAPRLIPIIQLQESGQELAAQAASGRGSRFASKKAIHKVEKSEKTLGTSSTSTTKHIDQQAPHGANGGSQKNRQPQRQKSSGSEGQAPAGATVKVSTGDERRTQRKRRRKPKKRNHPDGELQITAEHKQACIDRLEESLKSAGTQAASNQHIVATHERVVAILTENDARRQAALVREKASASQIHDSAARTASAAGVSQVRQESMPGNLQPSLAGQTVHLGSADSLAFLRGLGLSAESASDTLNTALSAASQRGGQIFTRSISAGQMEAVCRSLLELNIKVRDLGQMFVRYPALITSPADKLRERADKISEWFGRGSSKVNKETCLANLITAVPKILADPDAMARLEWLLTYMQNNLLPECQPEECSSALWAMACKCPEVFGLNNLDILHSIRFLSEQLDVDKKGTLRLLETHPEVLLRGTALSFDALLAVLPIQKAELEVTIRQRPLTLGTDVERARAMVKAFRAAGMEDAELTQLVQSFPAVLSASPKNLQVRLAFLTKLLGMPAHSILGAPSLFLNRSVVTTIGPRFSFIKDCLPDCTTKWAPTTILRSSDEDFCELTEAPLEQYAIYKKQWKEANGKRFQANS